MGFVEAWEFDGDSDSALIANDALQMAISAGSDLEIGRAQVAAMLALVAAVRELTGRVEWISDVLSGK